MFYFLNKSLLRYINSSQSINQYPQFITQTDLVNHLYDYRPNWTPLSPITIINLNAPLITTQYTFDTFLLTQKHNASSSPALPNLWLLLVINNYWMRLSMVAIIIKAKVCVICRSRRLRRITQTEASIIIAIMRKPNPIIGLLCIFLSCTCKEKSAHKKVIHAQQSTCK